VLVHTCTNANLAKQKRTTLSLLSLSRETSRLLDTKVSERARHRARVVVLKKALIDLV
jgi:hypothetical protein